MAFMLRYPEKPVHDFKSFQNFPPDQNSASRGLVIAVDASLGQKKHLGYVTIADGALYPGAAVQKELPPVGDIHITGIVNIAGVLEQLTLQTTRLSTVISLADTITQGIVNYTNSLICL